MSRRASGEPVLAGAVLLLGLLAGVLWRVLGSGFASAGEPSEAVASYDVLFAGLALAGGLLTGLAAVGWPARSPLVRFSVALGAGTAASLLAWGLGVVLGSPGLRSIGALLVWPLIVAATVFAVSLSGLVRRGGLIADRGPRPQQRERVSTGRRRPRSRE